MKIAGFHPLLPASHQDILVVGSQSVLLVEKTPGNEM